MNPFDRTGMWAVTVWGLAGPLRALKISSQYYYVGLGLLVVLLVIAMVKAYRVWEEIRDVEQPDSPADLLQAFQEARDAGELDDKEMERIRQQLIRSAMESPKRSTVSDQDDEPRQSP
jgi:cytochrome c-type biogenesis protein CcmH/NrfG